MNTFILFLIGMILLGGGILGWVYNIWFKVKSSFKAHSYALYPFLLGLCFILAAIMRTYALNN